MKIPRLPLLACLFASCLITPLVAQENAAPPARLGSGVFRWEDLAVQNTAVGQRRNVAQNPTPTLGEFECHITTLNPGKTSHPPHTHAQEELIILREGTVEVNLNGTTTQAGAGSVFFYASNNLHGLVNTGDKPATYFVFNFTTAATAALRDRPAEPTPAGHLGATVFDWQKLAVKTTATGERRDIFDRPSATLRNIECHVTTLKPGEAPHASHHHGEEEIVVIKEGQMEVTINGRTTQAGPGSIAFLASNDEHGWRNVGTTAATYYVLRLRTEKTPAD